jgi:hypothetical protein
MGVPVPKRRRITIDQRKLSRVQQVLAARTAVEAVDKALDHVLFGEEVTTALRAVAGKGKRIMDVFGNLR